MIPVNQTEMILEELLGQESDGEDTHREGRLE